MKRLAILGAAVLSLLGVAVLYTPATASATEGVPCSGIRIRLSLGTAPAILDLCIPDDLVG